MRKVVIFIIFAIHSMVVYSQYESVNWIFFIDGKLPESTVFSGKFICFENTPKEKIIEFKYTIGDIKILTDDLNYIKENGDSIEKLTVELRYKEFAKKSRNTYIYSFDISSFFLLRFDYVVFRITNLDKKKGIFYLGYSTSEFDTVWYCKESRIFTRIDTKVHKKGTTNNTIIMKQKR